MKKNSKRYVSINGDLYFEETVLSSPYQDLDGNPVKRTKQSHPYSYAEFVLWRSPDFQRKHRSGVYSDRLWQWDSKKHNALCEKHFGDKSQRWSQRDPSLIEKFLQDYNENPTLKLLAIVEGCNIASGYPYWCFFYDYEDLPLTPIKCEEGNHTVECQYAAATEEKWEGCLAERELIRVR